ncbi:DUF397 domain-containing protein [Pseudonocardia spinosispora]|uniref:DUF397 domain-containing protein n=1 Tax=Pseudonocardia spinosispora TaxID=103441 RepID=UPI000405C6FA|nr:DUF397 domain-containing protein [Pseudonocardia spinosispora]
MTDSNVEWTHTRFIKSSYSHDDGGDCVEIGIFGTTVGVRDSKLGSSSPVLELTRPAFATFLAEVAR